MIFTDGLVDALVDCLLNDIVDDILHNTLTRSLSLATAMKRLYYKVTKKYTCGYVIPRNRLVFDSKMADRKHASGHLAAPTNCVRGGKVHGTFFAVLAILFRLLDCVFVRVIL
jgi:hypothetical protein